MSTTTNQFELLDFTNNTATQKVTNQRSRLSRALLITAVVLLATGAYFYGASTTQTTNHKGFSYPSTSPLSFRETSKVTPLRNYRGINDAITTEGSLGRPLEARPQISGKNHQYQKDGFVLVATPLKKVSYYDVTEGMEVTKLKTTRVATEGSSYCGALCQSYNLMESSNHSLSTLIILRTMMEGSTGTRKV